MNIEFYKAFLKAQSEFPDIPKSKSGSRGFKYADLGEILKLVLPVLHRNGICIEQDIMYNENYQECIRTKLTHAESGQFSESTAIVSYEESDFNNKISFQVRGTGHTYFKRYALASKLCLYADEDTDGYTPEKKRYNSNSSMPSSSEFF